MKKKQLMTALLAMVSLSTMAQSNSRMTTMDLTASEMAHYMAPAWNLGNTMEAGWSNSDMMYKSRGTETENAWGAPTTTQEMISYVASQGFKSVRIPCAWVMGHITDADNMTIDPNWIARVKEIINYCLNAGMNVVINDHWDGGWLEYDGFTDGCDVSALNSKLSKLWTNIATALKDYDERVIFAGLNEPGVGGASPDASGSLIFSQYGTSTDAQMNAFVSRIQTYEQTFINAVRATGGNNAKRILVVQGPKVDATLSCTYFDMSKLSDEASNRLMFEVHYYDPYKFCQMSEDASWGNMQYYWAGSSYNYTSSTHKGTYYDSSVTNVFQNLKTTFVDKGYPVIIGEYGAMWRDISSISGESQDYHNQSIQYWYNLVTKAALQNGLIPFQWDTNSTISGTMSSINRNSLSVANTYIANGISEGASAGISSYNTIYAEPSSDSSDEGSSDSGSSDVSTTTTTKIEAEDATYSGSGCTKVSDSNFSSGYAIRMTDVSDVLTLNFNVETAGKYKVIVMAQGINGGKIVNCSVNGTSASFNTNALEEVEIGTYKLNTGSNTVTITPAWTWFDIDYVRIEKETSSIAFDIASEPVTSGATESAKNLYTFLKNNFGSKTVSGVMTGEINTSSTDITAQTDVQAVYTASGKRPALVGFDFMNATGKTVDSGNTWCSEYTSTAVKLATDLWNRGGIPAFTWHWRDPSRSTDEFYYNESDNTKTQFDFTTAMNSDGSWNTSSTIYQNMIKDIDKVADYFLQMQTAGVACIFRPLHEAEGGWFWWGAKDGTSFKKLYMLIYNEMVNVKGVKNIIWDYNSEYETADWCPDAQYYDIISTDIYNDAYDYSSNYIAFNKLKTLSSGKKMISLAECGPIPDIDNEADDEAIWTHWMVWYDSWSGNFVSGKTTTTEWAKEMADSRIITLEDMQGWPVDLVLTDGTPYTASSSVTAHSIEYSRSCANQWGTLCLPFAYSSNDDVQYYTVKSSTGQSIVVAPIDNVTAGQPIIYKILSDAGTNGKYTLSVSASNTMVRESTYGLSETPASNWEIKGTYSPTSIQNSDSQYKYYIASNQFWYSTKTTTIPTYRAWLEGPVPSNGAKNMTISIYDDDDISTSIVISKNSDQKEPVIYNLQGQRLSAPQKGINIINGKTILVK